MNNHDLVIRCLEKIADYVRKHRDSHGTALNDLLDELDEAMSKIPQIPGSEKEVSE